MADEEGYGEEGYTVMGTDHYTVEEEHHLLRAVISFFLGGVVGASIALLLTPQAGIRTRRQLREASADARSRAGAYYNQVRDKMGDAVGRGRDLVSDRTPLLSAAIEAGREAYEKEKQRRMGDKA